MKLHHSVVLGREGEAAHHQPALRCSERVAEADLPQLLHEGGEPGGWWCNGSPARGRVACVGRLKPVGAPIGTGNRCAIGDGRPGSKPEGGNGPGALKGQPACEPVIDGFCPKRDLPPAILTVGDFESDRALRDAAPNAELQARELCLELPTKPDLAGDGDHEVVILHRERLNEASQQEREPVEPESGHNRLAKTTIGLERDKR